MTTPNPFAARIAQAARKVAADKAVYAAREAAQERAAYIVTDARDPFTRDVAPAPMTPKQKELALTLLQERDLTCPDRPKYGVRLRAIAASWDTEFATMSRTAASAMITALLELPAREVKPFTTGDDVPAGHYAVTGTEGHTVFYKVDRPTEGRWAGFTFVERQNGDTYSRISRAEKVAALRAITADGPQNASMRYGRELEVCGVCARTLTNEESRNAGIGPVCRAKMGW